MPLSNLPPGVTQAMIDDHFGGPDPTPLQEDVWALLEKAGFNESQCNDVMSVIMDIEATIAKANEDYLSDLADEVRADLAAWNKDHP